MYWLLARPRLVSKGYNGAAGAPVDANDGDHLLALEIFTLSFVLDRHGCAEAEALFDGGRVVARVHSIARAAQTIGPVE